MRIILILTLLFGLTDLTGQNETDYYFGEVIIKIKATHQAKCKSSKIEIPSIEKFIKQNQINSIKKIFPQHKSLKKNSTNHQYVDLSTMYKFYFDHSISPKKIIHLLKSNPSIEYAELNYKNDPCFAPSDTLNNQQYYLNLIQAYQAWDIQKGDTNVMIGIGDTGFDMDHPDMINDYAYNYNDPINGVDDDNDGYIDNFVGWDVANNDNNPQLNNSGHGINVAAIASASTNNVTGISGVGFNTKILPLRIDSDVTGGLTGAYEAIVYAADFGAPIISNSWGSHNYSQFAQDIINYATLNKGCLVIAATGNNGNENRFYPAAYDNVLAVGASAEQDTIKGSSNYGYWADIFAPGENMLTCNAIGGYGKNGGTSMAAPVVAGVAALIKSQFPNYTWQQITEQIINTGDDVYHLNNAKYAGKLGGGRVNAFKAVTETNKPGIALINKTLTDNNDNIFQPGDTLRISGDFKNFLANASNVMVTISSIGNKLPVLNGSFNIGNLNQLDSISNTANPFTFIIPNNLNYNELIDIELSITANNYAKKQYLSIVANVNYLTVTNQNLKVSITSNGSIGFGGPNGSLGEGIQYKNGGSLLYDGSFMVGNSKDFIANRFRNDSSGLDMDFKIINPIKIQNSITADFESSTQFNDAHLNNPPLVLITLTNYAFKHGDADNSIIYEYTVLNVSNSPLNNLYGGLILDWDIIDYSKNKITYDFQRRMGISYATDTALYCGVRILTDSILNYHYAIDNTHAAGGGINLSDGFTDLEKFMSLSTNKHSAGDVTPEGNDIIDVNSIGPFNLASNESKKLAFSISVNENINHLKSESDSIYDLYQQQVLSIQEYQQTFENKIIQYPNPAKEEITLLIDLQQSQPLKLQIIDTKGSLVYEKNISYLKGVQILKIENLNLKSGIYFLSLNGDNIVYQNKIVISN